MTSQFLSDLWSEVREPRTRQDYAAFLGYSALPAMLPLAMVWSFQGLSWAALRNLAGGGTLYLVSVAVCSTLMLKAVMAGRREDRHVTHMLVFTILLAASVGFGLHYWLDVDGVTDADSVQGFKDNSFWLAVALMGLALGPVGLNTCRVASRTQHRAGTGRRAGDQVADVRSSGDYGSSETATPTANDETQR